MEVLGCLFEEVECFVIVLVEMVMIGLLVFIEMCLFNKLGLLFIMFVFIDEIDVYFVC